MATQISATWIGGVLQLDEDLPLAEHTRVRLTIETIPEGSDAERAWQSLLARLADRPIHAPGAHFSREELHERS